MIAVATEVADMDKMVAGFDPETFDPEAFAEGLMAEDRAAQQVRIDADVRRLEESPEAERLRREILAVRTPMAWHDDRRHSYKLWLRQEREVFYRLYEEAARRGQWPETDQSAVTMALNEVRKAIQALSDFDKSRQEERFTDRDDRPTRANEVLRGRLVRWAASKKQEKRSERLRKEGVDAAQQRKIARGLIQLRAGGEEAIKMAFLDEAISQEVFRELLTEIRKDPKRINVERHGYGAAARMAPKPKKKDLQKAKEKAKSQANKKAAGGGRRRN